VSDLPRARESLTATVTPPSPRPERLRAEIRGAVQGVGFRPFVFRLATDLGLAGWVVNDTRGVVLEVEGPRGPLERFLDRLRADAPPQAVVHSLEHTWLEPAGFRAFEIRHSDEAGARTAVLLPDLATCPDCLSETLTPGERRHRYPFTNCTRCGPRFSLIVDLPYDRPNTTMRGFAMCEACAREYADPLDRRFHAQPIACPECGPRLLLTTADGQERERGDAALREAARAIREGRIVAMKGLGGYQLLCDATNEEVVRRLRGRKGREEKPFALMCADLSAVRALCEVDAAAAAVLGSRECPIMLLPRRAEAAVSPEVAPRLSQLGVMLPASPLHHLLCAEAGMPLVATSGNLSDEPIAIGDGEARSRLGAIADDFLSHNRPIERHVDDSVGFVLAGEFRLLRRARGYAPLPVRVRGEWPTILAVGAHLKNTVALAMGGQVFLSQHIGDLETRESLRAFERVIEDFLRLYEARPVAIAHDLHPDYLSTQWARAAALRLDAPLVAVQHHHAHLASCLAEHGVEGPALGVTWDGTGWGPDGTVWGGEFLLGDAEGFERVAHLRPFRLPGGEASVREPRRTAVGLLREALGPAWAERDDLAPVRAFGPRERGVLERILERGLGSPLTSSAGRLFDAVAALAGLGDTITFEGQAAMHFEFAADPDERGAYPLAVRPAPAPGAPLVLDWEPLLHAVLEDVARHASAGVIAARTHNGLVLAIAEVARVVGVPRVVLSGGCFQNRRLAGGTLTALEAAGHEVLLHRLVPPNDGGVSLGQAAVAAARLMKSG
jgi:hydrogenase maturation protein HypF